MKWVRAKLKPVNERGCPIGWVNETDTRYHVERVLTLAGDDEYFELYFDRQLLETKCELRDLKLHGSELIKNALADARTAQRKAS